jgi:hypothetical protein
VQERDRDGSARRAVRAREPLADRRLFLFRLREQGAQRAPLDVGGHEHHDRRLRLCGGESEQQQ